MELLYENKGSIFYDYLLYKYLHYFDATNYK